MKVYVVGGAVRDELLGLQPVRIVTGSLSGHPEEMLAAGFRPVARAISGLPASADQEEYALARTERKTALRLCRLRLSRRLDVTLKRIWPVGTRPSMRWPAGTTACWSILTAGRPIFRSGVPQPCRLSRTDPAHPASSPFRCALVTEFTVAPGTMALMREMVWQWRGRCARSGTRVAGTFTWTDGDAARRACLIVLRECGALKQLLLPELDRLWGVPQRANTIEIDTGVHRDGRRYRCPPRPGTLPVALRRPAAQSRQGDDTEGQMYAHGTQARSVKLADTVCARLKVHHRLSRSGVARRPLSATSIAPRCADTIVRFVQKTDALRRPQRFER